MAISTALRVTIFPKLNLAITWRVASRLLGPRGILVLDLANRISGLAKGNQHSLGEVDTFFVTFRDLVPRRAVSRTGMINESGFDGPSNLSVYAACPATVRGMTRPKPPVNPLGP